MNAASGAVELLVAAAMALNLAALGRLRARDGIRSVAQQGALLGCVPALLAAHPRASLLLLASGTVLVKGYLVPRMLRGALRGAASPDEERPRSGVPYGVLLGAAATAAALRFAPRLPVLAAQRGSLILPASFATIASGFLLMGTRSKAIGQVLGYLVLENGVFLFGLLLAESTPLIVEMGVLLDLFAAAFVAGIVIHRIQATFASLDTRRLNLLKD